jgi:hypothetical protein
MTTPKEQDACNTYLHSSQIKTTMRQKVHSLWGYHFIVLHESLQVKEDQWYSQEILPNGDIYLRVVDIFSSKNKSRPQVSQQADDQTEGLYHHV